MSITPESFHFQLNRLINTRKFLIAYSGGVDSHVLLHLCAALKNHPSGSELEFSAIYIDHGLSPEAKKWGQHCQQICYALDIPLTIMEVNARPENGQSPEAAARTVRYQAFSEILTKEECLLTAQHLDDQAETLLLQLMRGSGIRGLSAMPEVKTFGKGWLCRPMLEYKKHAILDYARLHQLQWVEDESNQEQQYDRNFLRHSIIPELEKHWPAVQANIARSAQLMAESQFLLDEMAKQDFTELAETENARIDPSKLVLDKVRDLTVPRHSDTQVASAKDSFGQARLHNLLRYWLHFNALPMPSRKILQQIIDNVICSRKDASPVVSWKRDHFQCEIRKYRNTLYLINRTGQSKTSNKHREQTFILQVEQPVKIPVIGLIEIQPVSSISQTAYSRKKLLEKELTIRFRQGGERFRKYPGAPSTLLKHWFQEQAIPPWERDNLPLIYRDNELIQIGNFMVNNSFCTEDKQDSCIICFKREQVSEISG